MTLPDPDSLRLFSDPAYKQPTHEDVRWVCDLLGYSDKDLAALVGVKDGSNVRRWRTDPKNKTHVPINYARWRLLVLEARLVRPPPSRPKHRKKSMQNG